MPLRNLHRRLCLAVGSSGQLFPRRMNFQKFQFLLKCDSPTTSDCIPANVKTGTTISLHVSSPFPRPPIGLTNITTFFGRPGKSHHNSMSKGRQGP